MKLNGRLSILIITVLVLAFGVAAVADYSFTGKDNARPSITTADMHDSSVPAMKDGATCPTMKQQCGDKSKAMSGSCSEMKSDDPLACAPGDCSGKAAEDCAPGACDGMAKKKSCGSGDYSAKKSGQCPVTGDAKESSETTA